MTMRASTSPLEQALIEALDARYAADPEHDRAVLNQAYAESMAKAERVNHFETVGFGV